MHIYICRLNQRFVFFFLRCLKLHSRYFVAVGLSMASVTLQHIGFQYLICVVFFETSANDFLFPELSFYKCVLYSRHLSKISTLRVFIPTRRACWHNHTRPSIAPSSTETSELFNRKFLDIHRIRGLVESLNY